MKKRNLAAPLALALVLASPVAHAVRAPDHGISSGGLEVAPGREPLRREVMTSYTQIPKGRRAAWATFLADVGSSRWQALWDTSIGVPLRVFGEGVPAPHAVENPEAALKHARAFIERHRDLFAPGVAMSSLTLAANHLDAAGMRTVSFLQRAPLASAPWGNAPAGDAASSASVVHGQLSLRFKNDRLFVIASEVIPFARATPPVVDPKSAEEVASSWIGELFDAVKLSGAPELVALPLVRERGVETVTAWRVRVNAGPLPVPYDVYIDASSGARVARDMLGRFYQGAALYNVGERYPQGARKSYAPRLVDVSVNGSPQTSDVAGAFSWNDASPASVDLFVHGAETFVFNAAGSDATKKVSVTDGGTVEWSLADDEHGDAQLSTFIHASIVKNHALTIAPSMNFLLDKLTAKVNQSDPNFQCNAFWNGTSVNFFVEWGPCNNTGRIADVIYHEFGHGFHQNAMILGVGQHDPALAEGQADYMACSTTGDPDMAPGFFTNGTVLRRCGNDRRWPQDINADPHETGLIFTGAMWDLRTSLIKDLGQAPGAAKADALYYGALQRSSTVPTTYVEVLAADDDDGDLANGTPNICAINAAFVAHGLSPYASASGLLFKHDPLTIVPFGPGPLAVRVSQESVFPQCGSSSIDKVQLLWGPTGLNNKVTMTAEGSDFVGEIPPQADGAQLRYRVTATVGGLARTLPENPADAEYRVFVGEVTPLYCNDFETSADDWTFTSASGGAGDFKWGPPEGLAEDPAKAYSGDMVIGNDLTTNGVYAPNKTSYADSPVIDLAGNKHIRLQYRRWLAVEDGYFDQAMITVNGKQIWENEGTSQSFGQLRHIDKEWRFDDHDISWVPAGGATTVQVRFGLAADESGEAGGWTIDDFCVVAWKPASVSSGEGGGGAGGGGAGGDAIGPEVDEGCACEAAGRSGGGDGASMAGALSALGLVVIGAERRRRRSSTSGGRGTQGRAPR